MFSVVPCGGLPTVERNGQKQISYRIVEKEKREKKRDEKWRSRFGNPDWKKAIIFFCLLIFHAL